MGEIAEMILEGILCQSCGAYIDDYYAGFPRTCGFCRELEKEEKRKGGRVNWKRTR